LYPQKFLMTFFLVINHFYPKFTPLYFYFFVSVSLLLLFFMLEGKIKKNSPLIIGGWGKRGFAPILIIGGHMPGLPLESTPMLSSNTSLSR